MQMAKTRYRLPLQSWLRLGLLAAVVFAQHEWLTAQEQREKPAAAQQKEGYREDLRTTHDRQWWNERYLSFEGWLVKDEGIALLLAEDEGSLPQRFEELKMLKRPAPNPDAVPKNLGAFLRKLQEEPEREEQLLYALVAMGDLEIQNLFVELLKHDERDTRLRAATAIIAINPFTESAQLAHEAVEPLWGDLSEDLPKLIRDLRPDYSTRSSRAIRAAAERSGVEVSNQLDSVALGLMHVAMNQDATWRHDAKTVAQQEDIDQAGRFYREHLEVLLLYAALHDKNLNEAKSGIDALRLPLGIGEAFRYRVFRERQAYLKDLLDSGDWDRELGLRASDSLLNRAASNSEDKAKRFHETWLFRNVPSKTLEGYISEDFVSTLWHTAKGDFEKRFADCNEAIRCWPNWAMGYYKRGIARRESGEYDKAITDFSQAIRLDPNYANARFDRGVAWRQRVRTSRKNSDYDNAVADYTEAIRLKPGWGTAYRERGILWAAKGDHDRAIDDLGQAIRLEPNSSLGYTFRGLVLWKSLGKFERAIADLSEAKRLAPERATSYSFLAQLLSTCADSQFRDAQQAIELATKACELSDWKDAKHLGTLAAAYAEAGDYDKAVRWQTKADNLYSESMKERHGHLLDLYRSGKPYQEKDTP